MLSILLCYYIIMENQYWYMYVIRFLVMLATFDSVSLIINSPVQPHRGSPFVCTFVFSVAFKMNSWDSFSSSQYIYLYMKKLQVGFLPIFINDTSRLLSEAFLFFIILLLTSPLLWLNSTNNNICSLYLYKMSRNQISTFKKKDKDNSVFNWWVKLHNT